MSALILGEFPDWKDYAGIDEYNGEIYFNVVLPSPSKNIENPLRVYTYQDEITVSFDAYHAHFYEFKEEDSEILDDDAFLFSLFKKMSGSFPVQEVSPSYEIRQF